MVSINLDKLLKKFMPKFLKAIDIDYVLGSKITINFANDQDKKTKIKPLNLTKKDQKANIEIIESLVKDVNSEMAKKINYIINKGITDKLSTDQVSKELKTMFDKDSQNYFNYKDRFKNIATTESFRIMNQGANNTALRLGASKKYLYNVMDAKTAEDSIIADDKYGSEDKAIPVNEPFKYTYKGKERVFMLPPDRPRDRGLVLYTWDEI